MALGGNGNYQTNNNGNQQSMWEPSYYSRLRIKNNGLSLGFTFWKGTLRVAISGSGSPQEGRNGELAYIHLSPTKARVLAAGVKRIIENTESSDSYGVDTGIGETRGLIVVGRNIGVPFLFIAKVNSVGEYESAQKFDFNNDYNYMLKMHDIENLKYQKEFMNNIELQQFCDLLEDYSRFASGALGASVHDINRYEAAKLSNTVHAIGKATGAIKFNADGTRNYAMENSNNSGSQYNNNRSTYNNSNYNNNRSNGNNNNTNRNRYDNIDDLESELG